MRYVWHSFLWSITPPFYKLSLHFLLYHPFQKLPRAPPSPHEIKKNFEHWWNYEIIADYCSKKSSSHEEYNRHTFFFLVVWSTKNIATLFKIPLYTWNMMWKCLNCFFLNLLLYFSIDSTFWKFSSSKKFPFPPFYNPPTLVFLLFILTFLYPSPYSLFGEVLSLHLAKERVMKLWPNNSVTEKSFVKKNPWNTGMIHWNEHSYQMEFCLDTRLTGQKKVVGFSASCRYHFCHILTNFYTLHLTSSYQGDKLSTQCTNICHTFPVYAKFLEAVKVFARPYNILLLSFVNSGPAFFIGWKFLCFLLISIFVPLLSLQSWLNFINIFYAFVLDNNFCLFAHGN